MKKILRQVFAPFFVHLPVPFSGHGAVLGLESGSAATAWQEKKDEGLIGAASRTFLVTGLVWRLNKWLLRTL